MFSQQTLASVQAVADRAKAMWTGAKQKVGFGWDTLITLLLSFIQEACKPKTAETRARLVKQTAQKCSDNGVAGCIECCVPEARAKKLRKKMANHLGLKTAILQDAHFFNAVMAANADKEHAVAGLGSAFDGDESDDEE